MKPVARFLAAVATMVAWGCSGGGGNPTPAPPPAGKFSNADLKGTYAFSMSGTDATAARFGAFIARVGSFAADGNGNITAAMEDVTDAGQFQTVAFSGGVYSIQANGKGTVTLNSTGGGLQLSVVLNSASAGIMIQTDLNATSSGSFTLQSPGQFLQSTITGGYVFDVSGLNAVGAPVSYVGKITTSGTGQIQGGVIDTNDGGVLSGPQMVSPIGAMYQLDPANGTTFGRGTITFGAQSFAFYIVDGTRFKLLEEDTTAATFGDALQQSASVATSDAGFKGDFTFLIGGSAVLGTAGPVVHGAAFTADGAGNVSAIALDDNNAGTVRAIGGSTTISNAVYAIDAANAGSGRGTISFTATSNPGLGTFSFVFYLISPTQAFIQDTSNGIVGDGTMFAQGSSFTASGLAGDYALNWSGVNLGGTQNLTFEVDADAQLALSSSGGITGEIDLVEPGSTSTRAPVFTGVAASGSLAIAGNGTGSNTVTVTAATNPSNTFHYHAYIVSNSLILLVGSDTDRVIAGNASLQP